MPEPYRAAVYYAPQPNDPLWHAGCAWLGRDPELLVALPQPDVPGIAAHTTDPARYGFHATLKPPMQLTDSFAEFLADAEILASRQVAFALPELAVRQLGSFVALCLTAPLPELDNFAAACVRSLDRHRRPEDTAAPARRAAGRSVSQIRNIADWGYPLVLDDWRFHMTLSNAGGDQLYSAAREYFEKALRLPRRVEGLAVFVEPSRGAPFQLARRLPFSVLPTPTCIL